ncbi:hypothetical protein PENFLA_c093G03774 [Penicillium flavigenum]|uniref:Uncharacterized protein n=1 Tax=Penicillium flavigenum TaxID=254877 RepID=A0A1V6S8B0_9EURO|nr:hypothetical protein PENFLA_c093G03774 [Penicillium flavigenum]
MIEKPSSMVVDAALGNRYSGYEILQMLENYFGQFDLCEANVTTAAESGSQSILTLVLDRCSITEATPSVLLAAAAKGSLDVMKHLLKLKNAVVTEEILIAASGNLGCSIDMLKLLWNFAPHIKVCPGIFLNAADPVLWRSAHVEYLFSRVKDSKTCQDLLEAVMTAKDSQSDWISGIVLECILESEFDIEVTDELVIDVLKAGRGRLLKIFFDHGIDIELSQDMVSIAVQIEDYWALLVLVEHGNSDVLNLQEARVIIDNIRLKEE